MKTKPIPPYYCINWNTNQKEMEYYDIMPYFVDCWYDEKKHKHKHWNRNYDDGDKNIDDTKMPETFEEFKKFILGVSLCRFWSKCECEVIVSAWPPHPKRNEDGSIKMFDYDVYYPEKQTIPTIDFYENKIDIYQQIKINLDVVAKHFMDYILSMQRKQKKNGI